MTVDYAEYLLRIKEGKKTTQEASRNESFLQSETSSIFQTEVIISEPYRKATILRNLAPLQVTRQKEDSLARYLKAHEARTQL